jgi:hypothetical protein
MHFIYKTGMSFLSTQKSLPYLISFTRALRFVSFGECPEIDRFEAELQRGFDLVERSGNCYLEAPGISIDPRIELTFGSSVLLVAISVFMLHRFIQEYALSLLDRKNHVTNMTKINEDLRSQMKKLKVEVDLDLDTPLTKVIKCIRDIQEVNDLNSENMDNLDYVIEILSSNQLFLPNFLRESAQGLDGDVSKWLNNMVTNQTVDPRAQILSTAQLVQNIPEGELLEVLVRDIHP